MFCGVTLKAQKKDTRPAKIDSTLTADSLSAMKVLTAAQKDSIRLSRRTQTMVGSDGAATIQRADSLFQRTDTFSLRLSKDTLDAPVNYEAEDSAVILAVAKKIILYGKGKTVYKDITLTAPQIELNQQTSLVSAYNNRDSLGEVITRARFEQAENKFESDTIRYNFKTQKGLTQNTFTNQQEIFIQGELIKKVDSVTVNISRARFTTCELDEPHFAFRANKMKVINNKVGVSGPVHPEFEGVPVPVYLPFGYYPLSKGRRSGMLPPQFTATENQGIGLQGIGYYKVLNDNFDATIRGDLYSYGAWRADVATSYRFRYRSSGSLNLSYQNTKVNFKGDPDYFKTKTFFITWGHSMDQRARPGVNFSASVNAGSTRFNRLQLNSAQRAFQNQLGSSITYSKTWKDKPFNLTLAANHNQNNETRLINVMLPEGSFSVNTIYPLERKEENAIGAQKWYEKLGIGYQGSFRNQVSFYDSAFSTRQLLDTLQWGAVHNIPLTVALPSLGPLIVSPSISYQQQWMMRRQSLAWNQNNLKIDTTIEKGFYAAHSLSFGVGVNTSFFGTYQFKKSRVIAIRHTVRPTFSLSYSPNLAKNYYSEVQVTNSGEFIPYNLYEGNLYTGYSNTEFGGIGFGIDNVLEMKKRSKKDTVERKIRLIDGFGFSSNFNFLQPEYKLGDFNLYLRSNLFDKINLNVTTNLSPYAYDTIGRRISRYAWRDGVKLGQLTNGSLSLSTSFRSKPRDASKPAQPTHTNSNAISDPTLLGDQQRLADYMRRNPAEFVDFNIPYDFSVDLAVSFFRPFDTKTRKFRTEFNSSLNFRNSFSLTPKWNFSTNGYFNLDDKKLEMFTVAINRDMHCWQMSIAITPVGFQRYFNITISPKSSLLQNLKVNRTRIFNNF
ncbi:MAG: hypothetical protein JWP69_1038 [Flaviaesturariibacter sp.]|nr:hypothetical protein [Flaviaesturariibacter sp.]